ncbi:MAG TPA: M13 family metallopeptidase N-terminal domain-containing protein, partial [Chitinophagaceae bacterium]|nr:M13 family metallopeptidase N-terminal domain-containing protein [Chitinophagaceae bacterium]
MKKALLSFSSLLILLGFSAFKRNEKVKSKFIQTDYMDSSVKPGDNFFLFVNGKWIKQAVIPPTESGVGSFLDLRNGTKNRLRLILDSVSKVPQPKGSLEEKVGAFYASGMDSAAVEKRGYDPIK